jgi:hypothetical protein
LHVCRGETARGATFDERQVRAVQIAVQRGAGSINVGGGKAYGGVVYFRCRDVAVVDGDGSGGDFARQRRVPALALSV